MYKILEDLTYDSKHLLPGTKTDLAKLDQAQIDSLIQRGIVVEAKAKAEAEEKQKNQAKAEAKAEEKAKPESKAKAEEKAQSKPKAKPNGGK